MKRDIPITKPVFDHAEENAVLEVLRSGWVAQGPKVAAFESALARYVGTSQAIAATSCTTALHLVLAALGIGPGDEVIVPAFTFVATANAVEYQGGVPVFVDVDLETFNMAADELEAKITPRTRAIVPVHLFGLTADMTRISDVARRRRVAIVEDAACAIGSRYAGQRAGALGAAAVFSFHPRKIITTGEGGAVTTDDAALAERIRVLRNHGAKLSDLERHRANAVRLPEYDEVGFNYRMTDLQAAIGVTQLQKIDALIGERRALAAGYTRALTGIRGVRTPYEPDGRMHTYQAYVVLVDERAATSRDEMAASLSAKGIAVRQGTHAVHLLGYYREKYGLKERDYPNAWKADTQTLTLPLYPGMDAETQGYVIDAVRTAARTGD